MDMLNKYNSEREGIVDKICSTIPSLYRIFAILNCTIIHDGRRRMMKILVVDDESSIRNLIRMQLEMEGYEVLAAADGEKL